MDQAVITVARVVAGQKCTAVDPAMPRHLITTEIGRRLTGSGIAAHMVYVPALPSGLGVLASAILAHRQIRKAQVLLVDQGLGIRLAALRALGLMTPKLAMISYDPFPSDERWLSSSIRAYLYRYVDLMLLVSTSQANWLRSRVPRMPRVASLPMSVDLDVFRRERSPLGNYLFMVDGALRDYETVAAALSQIRPTPQMVVAYHRESLSAAAGIQTLRHARLRVETVRHASPSQLRSLYEDARLVLIPLRPSSQPVGLTALLEAMAMGCPIVMSDNTWLHDYAQHELQTMFVPQSSPLAMMQAVIRLTSRPDFAAQLGEAASARAKDYSFGRSIDALRKAISDLCGSGAPDGNTVAV